MDRLLLVGVGGSAGAILRYLISGWVQAYATVFPLGTLTVNFLGTLILGLVMFSSEYAGMFDERTRLFMTIGVLGAFTTMSTFGYESFKLLEQKETAAFVVNVLGTMLLMLLAIYISKMMVLRIGGD
ncbi:MAG: fluoride efflux transporter CrcB [Candidatus Micrarchaeota archaeon]